MTSSQNQAMVDNSNSENPHIKDEERLPFAFARRNGIMITGSDDATISLTCREHISATTLLEIQRYYHKAPIVQAVESEAFNALLQQSYEQQSHQDSMESFDDEIDLSGVAEAYLNPKTY